MIITWQIEDGYAGKSRPQHTEIPDDDWEQCQTEEERQRLIEDYVQEDFENRISWCIVHIG